MIDRCCAFHQQARSYFYCEYRHFLISKMNKLTITNQSNLYLKSQNYLDGRVERFTGVFEIVP